MRLTGQREVPNETSNRQLVLAGGGEPETVSGEALVGEIRGTLAVTRTAPSYDIESMRAFASLCPGVVITTNREKADVIVRVERDDPNPTTPFVKTNKVAVFNLEDELVYATRARLRRRHRPDRPGLEKPGQYTQSPISAGPRKLVIECTVPVFEVLFCSEAYDHVGGQGSPQT